MRKSWSVFEKPVAAYFNGSGHAILPQHSSSPPPARRGWATQPHHKDPRHEELIRLCVLKPLWFNGTPGYGHVAGGGKSCLYFLPLNASTSVETSRKPTAVVGSTASRSLVRVLLGPVGLF